MSLTAINPQAYYPEGPLWHEGRLYYAEMMRERITVWDGRRHRTFWTWEGCSPGSIAPFGPAAPRQRFLVMCHLEARVAVIEAAADGLSATLQSVIERDDGGREMPFPNASTADGRGGVYFSSSGTFDPQAPSTGAVMHLRPGQEAPRRLVDGIRYANGVAMTPDRRTLFVSEHLGRRVLSYRILPDGRLTAPRVFAVIDEVAPPAPDPDPELSGPDGLTLDADGNLWVAEYGASRLLQLGPEGRLLRVVPVPDQYVTSLTRTADPRTFYVTAPATNQGPDLIGRVYRMEIR